MPDSAYDFRRCKLCGQWTSAPLYILEAITVHGCSRCDFHAIDYLDSFPANDIHPETDELDSYSWNYIEERVAAPDPLMPLRINLIREHCLLKGTHCLDVGAGVGQFMRLLTKSGALPFGLEPSRIRREFARRKFGLALHRGTIESFYRRENYAESFDVVTLWDVIEHVNFPGQAMAAALHVLKPGGLLFIDTPSRDTVPYRLSQLAYRLSGGKTPLFLESFYSNVPFGHKQIFRPGQLVRLAEETGFQVISVKRGYDAGKGLATLLRPRNRIVLTCRRPDNGKMLPQSSSATLNLSATPQTPAEKRA